jgi:hypothetical protein
MRESLEQPYCKHGNRILAGVLAFLDRPVELTGGGGWRVRPACKTGCALELEELRLALDVEEHQEQLCPGSEGIVDLEARRAARLALRASVGAVARQAAELL